MQAHYILIVGETVDTLGRSLSARETADIRLQNSNWPLYENTPNRSTIKQGDGVLVYFAGSSEQSQTFYASSVVSETINLSYKKWEMENLASEQAPTLIVKLKDIVIFKDCVNIRPLLNDLTFIPKNKSKWGCVMHTGCRRISKEDYLLISEAKK